MNEQQNYINKDEITLKELILKIQEYWRELWEHWYFILLCIILSSAVFAYKYMNTPTTYSSRLTFMIDANEAGGFNMMSSVLSQFGLGGSRKSNLDKILAISKSRRIIYDVLLKSAEINERNDVFANHFIETEGLREKWKSSKIDGLSNYYFNSQDSLNNKNYLRDNVLNILYSEIIGGPNTKDPILASAYNEDIGIMKIEATSKSEEFAMLFVDSLFNHLSQYYILKSTEKARKTYGVLRDKADSIYQQLMIRQNSLANIRDRDRNAYLRGSRVSQERLLGDIEVLARTYAETYKNTEFAALDLDMKTPYITVIDRPRVPLKKNQPSLIRALLMSLILGGFVGSCIVVGRKIIRDAMND